MKLGFIGVGNMASAIIKGIVEKDFIKGEAIYVYDHHPKRLAQLAKDYHLQICQSETEVINQVDTLMFAVKPNIILSLISKYADLIKEKQLTILSIAAGTTLSQLKNAIGQDCTLPIIRIMPNVNAMVGLGAAAICGNEYTTDDKLEQIVAMFNAVGKAWVLAEKDFSAFTAIAGSSPAYAYLFIDALARAAVKHGLPKQLSTQIAAQAVLGSAQMVLDANQSPWDLIDTVCSPGGTTVAGLLAMEEANFMTSVVKGIDATINKDQEMQNKK
ncbi:pyrroline-5-carboxylate reductase [Enterococcus columbae]|uniref:Pyrroline-5-carboxylate reductase n=1 Tax=Enterococcus columbae DSM 7374 = ATCC 51263 TaxID=1121865 RepID=S1NU93_9ENTE|nr:pyrroline-5-carboxylate reductase [Enterococcus columbae]EOT44276.1 pyrroline-5-carboxylate reductase [Enterococcus columbae DSM 7374 = ATCC 51263]EOW84434.1 pyrroline-5-carboxylate reductase [Enterococcus columbae DSM 7374 = ATCC 51263]OJG26006.1 pyrroline-5-carboxylate reductase [Enterococcus columbae DSM 7374 = ATCC 51263]